MDLFREKQVPGVIRGPITEPQVCVINPLLEGTDGNAKMSKSLGNSIGIDDPPNEMFGKAMSVPDTLIFTFMWLATDLTADEINIASRSLQPMEAKLLMARALVTRWHGAKSGVAAELEFRRVFSQREAPTDIPVVEISTALWKVADLLQHVGLVSSKSEGRRKLAEKAVKIDGETILTEEVVLKGNPVIKLGRQFIRVNLD